MRFFVILAVAATVGACAKSADSISASYVSPTIYRDFSCAELSEEAQRVSSRAVAATGAQNQAATRDAVATTVGVVVFWPALFLIGGNDTKAAELAQLKGSMEAIEQASIQKRCGIRFQRAPEQST
ncbi:MAG: hypothetical protein AB7O79_02195 [Xanthobacteraceae bacterium]